MADPLNPTPEIEDDWDPSDWITARRRAAQSAAQAGLGESPDDGARAMELAQSAGVPAPVVHGDLEGFEAEHKARLTSSLLQDNEFLRNYALSNPMAPVVSNDDWGQLDAVSAAMQKFSQTREGKAAGSILGEAAKGFKEGWGMDASDTGRVLLGPARMLFPSTGQPETDADKELQRTYPNIYEFLNRAKQTILGPSEALQGLFAGVVKGGHAAVTQAGITAGMSESDARGLANELAGMAEAELGGLSGRHGMHVPMEAVAKVADAYKAAEPYLKAGKEPPVGIHPEIDNLHKEQTKLDLKNLDEAFSESQKSATRERNPDLFADFIRQHSDARIGISIDGLRELYGEKVPDQDDSKLGWVPNLPEQWRLAEAGGGDIEVPLADWLAKADPDVAKELHDHLRVRPGAKTLVEWAEPEARTPFEQEYGKGEGESSEQLAAKFNLEDKEQIDYGPQIGTLHNFNITSEEGEHQAELSIWYNQGTKTLDIADIAPPSGMETALSANRLGPSAVRDLLRQLREKFPEAQSIRGYRVTGARWAANATGDALITLREAAKLDPLLEKVLPPETEKHTFGPEGGEPIHYYLPAESWTKSEKAIVDSLDKYMKSIAPQFDLDRLFPTRRLEWDKQRVEGLYQGFHDRAPMIFYSLHNSKGNFRLPEKILGTVRHEAVHYLWRGGFFTEAEKKILNDNAGEWIKKYKIDERYGDVDHETQLEEAIAHEFEHWNLHPKATYVAADVFQKMKDALIAVADHVKKIFGYDPRVEDIFHKIEGGEVGSRTPRVPEEGGEAQAAMASREREDDLVTRAAALGMTRQQYERYRELMRQRDAEDAEFQLKQGEREERIRQTKEWKENYDSVRAETSENVYNRPDIAADRFLREGILYGEKVTKPRIARDEVPAELRSRLPDYILGDRGMHPDDVAGLFGYQSGDRLVENLANLEDQRKLEDLTPKDYERRVIDAETEREMRKRFGDLEENILEGAKDHVLGTTQLDMLHEEMVALGQKANAGLTIAKGDIARWVKSEFDKTPVGKHDSDKYLAQAGRAGEKAERALLEASPTDAFKAKQEQYIAMLLAKEAKKLEKSRAQFDKTAKSYSRREVPGTPAEYTNWIHDILMRTGNPVRRSIQDLQEAIGRADQQDLAAFTRVKNQDISVWEDDPDNPPAFETMPVAPFLFDSSYRTKVDDMTAEEFKAVHDSIKTLIKNGRDERKINIDGEKRDLKEVLDRMTTQMQTLFKGERQYAFGHQDRGAAHYIRTAWASLLQIESIFNRFDRGDPKGLFRKAITTPIFEGSNTLNTLETKYSKLFKELNFPKQKDLQRRVENAFLPDPKYGGDLRELTKENVLAILQNVGNPSNLDKLTRGYGVKDKNAFMRWLFTVTTKEDWDRAQAIGDVFKQAFEESADMYHKLSGVAPEKIDLQPISTPFGQYEGWYHPVIYDPVRPGTSKKTMGPSPLDDGAYYRVATPSGYTKRRTGYAAPILLNFSMIPHRLRTMLNDTAMRPAVTEAAKIFYNRDWQNAIDKHYGKEIRDLFIPYLKDVAGQKMYKDAAMNAGQTILESLRQNLIATLIGFNPSTVMKHGPTAAMLSIKEVGAGNFFREVRDLLATNDELGEKNWTFAMRGGIVDGDRWNGSEELQRRHRNWQETLTGSQADLFGENTLRNSIIKLGATPVAISDLLSAVPTWLAAYKQQIRDGLSHGDAVAFADRAVRRAHGSSAIAARPRLMRGGPLAQLATPFYTFFNEMFQRQYEMAWRAKDALGAVREGDYESGKKELPNLMKGLFAYVLFPAIVEQLVSPVLTGNQSTTQKLLGWGTRTLASTVPIVRDFVEFMLTGHDPTIGMYSTAAETFGNLFRDLSKGKTTLDKAHAGKTIQHTVTAFGAATGLTNAQEGRTGRFIWDYTTGQQRPRDLHEVFKGLWHGQIQENKR